MNIIKYALFALTITFLSLFSSCSKEISKLEKETIFTISEDQQSIVLDGVVNSSALEKFKALSESYPQVKTLEIVSCEGSINDRVNLELGEFVHINEFSTHLNENGLVASGGTDLFLAGITRTKGNNTMIGVHSWSDGTNEAADFPEGDPEHQPYIDYYKLVGFTQAEAEAFYYFTINAASAEEMHYMTEAEIEEHNILKP